MKESEYTSMIFFLKNQIVCYCSIKKNSESKDFHVILILFKKYC